MKKIFTTLALLSVFICGLSNAFTQNFIKVTKTNQKQSINLSNDQVLEIQLPREASTGYVWCETKNSTDKTIPKTITQIGDADFINDPFPVKLANKKGRMVGGTGTQVIRYIGVSQGTSLLTLELRRPWEKNGGIIDSFTIRVVSAGKYTGTYTPPVKTIRKYNMPLTSKVTQIPGLPSSWDWRPQCTPIKDQGICQDCWAYATVGDLECNILIHDGVTEQLSEEFVTDCFNYNNCDGCTGGCCANEAWLASFTAANSAGGGAVYDSEDPTTCNSTGMTGICTAPFPPYQTIDSYADIGGEDLNGVPSVDSIKFRIYYDGPVFVAVDCANWESGYTGGIWVTSSATTTNHAVCLVGWKDTTVADNSGGYWILRNSWGAGFGINGYMYISYGSDLVGCDADYIVYKGGTPHDAPPIAAFTASALTSCSSDTVQFTDKSINFPALWSWTFGDGGTSNLQNPSHTYNANGIYTVSLTASNSYGNNTYTQIDYITIDMPASPTVTGASCNGPCSVTLNASCICGYPSCSLNWYNAATGGTLLYIGTSYTTPILTATTTYYVQNEAWQYVQFGGQPAPTAHGDYYTGAYHLGLVFDALSDIIINAVDIYADGSTKPGDYIWLKNSSGAKLDSVSISGIVAGHTTLGLSFSVPEGTGYVLGADPDCDLWKDDYSASFPHTMPGLVSFFGTTDDTLGSAHTPISTAYFYFYNWQVSPPTCLSAMVPVTVSLPMGINELSDSLNIKVNPNPATNNITIESPQKSIIEILNIEGEKIIQQQIQKGKTDINISGLAKGVYILRLCSNDKTAVTKILKE